MTHATWSPLKLALKFRPADHWNHSIIGFLIDIPVKRQVSYIYIYINIMMRQDKPFRNEQVQIEELSLKIPTSTRQIKEKAFAKARIHLHYISMTIS